MKKIILPLAVLSLLGTSVFAESCVLPEFIKEGAKIKFKVPGASEEERIVKIDKKSCWMKIEDGRWFNLNLILWIQPLDK